VLLIMPANSRWDLIRGLKGYSDVVTASLNKVQTYIYIGKQDFVLLISKGRRSLIECGTNKSRDTTLRHALILFPRR